MNSWITETPIDPWELLAEYEAQLRTRQPGKTGATAVFTGTMRDFNEVGGITGMELEHFPGMTETHLQKIVAEATQQWALNDALIVHRVGPVAVDDCIVLVAAWSARRAAAFDAARYLIEELKSRAPFWKKELFADQQSRWVTGNTRRIIEDN
jgi:molybdopterin synthase catalytic subunit